MGDHALLAIGAIVVALTLEQQLVVAVVVVEVMARSLSTARGATPNGEPDDGMCRVWTGWRLSATCGGCELGHVA